MLSYKTCALALCVLLTGCSLFEKKEDPKPVPMPPPEVTQAWLDEYEPLVRDAIKDSNFEMERRENLLVVTAPVKGSFNPDRPGMLLPVTLGPITRVAKVMEKDSKVGVLVLGHADSSGALETNRALSLERARAFTAIFRLSGLKQDRLMVKGMGPDMPRAANDSANGRELNRRVEILLTRQDTLQALIAKYSTPEPAPAAATAVAAADKPAEKAAAKADAKPAGKTVAKASTKSKPKAAAKPAAKPAAKAVAKTADKPAAKSTTKLADAKKVVAADQAK
ncbi:OmpA family protein [Pseudomonas fulva]|uniref:OmpA family protein n=1 Tax=Pseudomonas fulva TaxID=47880 RepID=UPI00201DCD38|nr:OmpA family protein [Pseudomonas fulva]UQY35659.1 OmpA family protein [Pseudomonas fulva]